MNLREVLAEARRAAVPTAHAPQEAPGTARGVFPDDLPPAHAREVTQAGSAARVVHLRNVIEHLERLTPRPAPLELRAHAARELAQTFPSDKHAELLDKYQTRTMLTGSTPENSRPAEVWIDVLAMHGWAQDRATHGPLNAGNWSWIEAAGEALRKHAQANRRAD